MMLRKPSSIGAAFLVVVLFMTACESNLATGFRTAFAATKPFVQQTLVQSGVITQEKANAVVADIETGIAAAEKCEACLKAIVSSGNEKKVAKAHCYFTLAQDLRAVLDRHNIGGEWHLDQISTLVSGAIAAFEAYYASVVPSKTSAARSTTATSGDPDAALKSKLEDVNRQLKALTGN